MVRTHTAQVHKLSCYIDWDASIKDKMLDEDEDTNEEYIYKPGGGVKNLNVMINSISDCMCDCSVKDILEEESASIDISIGNKHVIDTNSIDVNKTSNKETWSTNASISDVVCLGATLIIVVIQLSILIFYVFKDHETFETQK